MDCADAAEAGDRARHGGAALARGGADALAGGRAPPRPSARCAAWTPRAASEAVALAAARRVDLLGAARHRLRASAPSCSMVAALASTSRRSSRRWRPPPRPRRPPRSPWRRVARPRASSACGVLGHAAHRARELLGGGGRLLDAGGHVGGVLGHLASAGRCPPPPSSPRSRARPRPARPRRAGRCPWTSARWWRPTSSMAEALARRAPPCPSTRGGHLGHGGEQLLAGGGQVLRVGAHALDGAGRLLQRGRGVVRRGGQRGSRPCARRRWRRPAPASAPAVCSASCCTRRGGLAHRRAASAPAPAPRRRLLHARGHRLDGGAHLLGSRRPARCRRPPAARRAARPPAHPRALPAPRGRALGAARARPPPRLRLTFSVAMDLLLPDDPAEIDEHHQPRARPGPRPSRIPGLLRHQRAAAAGSAPAPASSPRARCPPAAPTVRAADAAHDHARVERPLRRRQPEARRADPPRAPRGRAPARGPPRARRPRDRRGPGERLHLQHLGGGDGVLRAQPP